MVNTEDVVRFVFEHDAVSGRSNSCSGAAIPDGEINLAAVYHGASGCIFLRRFRADGGKAGIERRPLVFMVAVLVGYDGAFLDLYQGRVIASGKFLK